MTREEKALIYFKTLRQRKTEDYSSVLEVAPKGSVAYDAVVAEIEVYDMAIKALEQQSCEDAISREAMLKYQEYLHGKMSNEENYKLFEFIKELPSVTPKQKTGKWIKLKDLQPKDCETVLVKNIDGDVTCAYMCDDICFFESFSGEPVDDVVEWREIPE